MLEEKKTLRERITSGILVYILLDIYSVYTVLYRNF